MNAPNTPIILLDLNYTLVANSDDPANRIPYPQRIQGQNYRSWLIKMLEGYRVFIITARPFRWKTQTLEHLERLENWQPERSYWNTHELQPPDCKQKILLEHLFPEFGNEVLDYETGLPGFPERVSPFFAIESNPRTRTMYARHKIPAFPCELLKRGAVKLPPWKFRETGHSKMPT